MKKKSILQIISQKTAHQPSYTCHHTAALSYQLGYPLNLPQKCKLQKLHFYFFELNRFRCVLRILFDEQWRKHLADFFQILLVNIVKGGQVLAVDVEDGCHFPTL